MTVNVGVRYASYFSPYDINGVATNFLPGTVGSKKSAAGGEIEWRGDTEYRRSAERNCHRR